MVTKVSSEYEESDLVEILSENLEVNSHLLSNHAANILSHTVKSGKIYAFRQPDTKIFGTELEQITNSLANAPCYVLKNDGQPSLSVEAIQKLQGYQNKAISEYNSSISEL